MERTQVNGEMEYIDILLARGDIDTEEAEFMRQYLTTQQAPAM